MDFKTLTAGAQRALDLAANLAAINGARYVETFHLLWALRLEETRAADILTRHKLTQERLAELLPLAIDMEGFSPESDTVSDTESDSDTHVAGKPRSERDSSESPEDDDEELSLDIDAMLLRVVAEAQRKSGESGKHAETGTEHLLWGLTVIDTPAADVLAQFGLTPEALAPQLSRQTGISTDPIEVDVRLNFTEPTETDHGDTLRVIDAAANRAREGLRVVEDFVRFVLEDAHLSGLLKQMRHDLAGALRPLDALGLVKSRETQQDVGTSLRTAAEGVRGSLRDVAQANFKRAEEALRTLEEFGKTVSSEIGQAIESLRYRLYTIEKAVLLTESARDALDGCDLYLLVSEQSCPHGPGPAIRQALEGGVSVVQVREKAMPDRRLIDYGSFVREWTREADALFIMNDRPDLAVLTDADGVHLGQEEFSVREARRIVGPDRLVGVSTHTIEQARKAVLDGADYLGVGPVFPSTTKKFDKFAGLEFVRQVAAEISLPWYAIGGITLENVGQVLQAGATRIAVSGAICGVEDHARAAHAFSEKLAGG